jgi:DNA replication protein DnaC
MLKALEEQINTPDCASLSFEQRFALLVEREYIERQNSRLSNRLRRAKLPMHAAVEDINFRHPRGLDKSQIVSLFSCLWIKAHDNIIFTGPTGTGKTYLSCAFGQKACREDFSVLYLRLPRLFEDLAIAKGDGRYPKLLASFAKADLIILDDWGISPLSTEERTDLFEILEDRYDRRSTIVVAQLPIQHWHDMIGDPTLADAILDRLIHNAYKFNLKGESMRKIRKPSNAGSSTKEV